MREILYKAKRIDNGKWVEGYLYELQPEQFMICDLKMFNRASTLPVLTFFYICSFQVNPETICQFTGLTDKHGNKIWENDIVSHIKYSERKAKVVYGEFNCSCCNGVYGWTLESIGGYSEVCDIRDCSSIEVIGTIFDNPELLKGGLI